MWQGLVDGLDHAQWTHVFFLSVPLLLALHFVYLVQLHVCFSSMEKFVESVKCKETKYRGFSCK